MKDGWFATGDIAVMSADGFFTIVDRKKDMVLVSGFNVYPNEVEEVIAQMDAVLEVAVIGVPDATTGEAVRAYVVPNPEHGDAVDVAQIIAHCKAQLTSYKVPKQIEVRDELPKSPVGKVLRKDLKAQAAAQTTRS
jgi:long-chain acyl-CoA synthetase